MSTRPHLQVSCALIEQDGRVLAAQRGPTMSLPLKWEFPGGKIHAGETPQDCLRRELMEELGVQIAVGKALPSVWHDYPGFRVTLYPFICLLTAGTPVLHEHAAVRWLWPHELAQLDWADADWPVLDAYLAERGSG